MKFKKKKTMTLKLRPSLKSMTSITAITLILLAVSCFAVNSPLDYFQRDSPCSSDTLYDGCSTSSPECSMYTALPDTPELQVSSSSANSALHQSSTIDALQTFIHRTNEFLNDGYKIAELYIAVLQKCSLLCLFSNLNQIIDSMMRQNIQLGIREMDISVWNTFFSVYYKPMDVVYGKEFLYYIDKMYENGSLTQPTTTTFNIILCGIAKNHQYEQLQIAEFIVNHQMEMHNVIPNIYTMTLLMKIYARPEYPHDHLKATQLMLKANIRFHLKQGNAAIIINYKTCVEGANITHYNKMIKYLHASLIISDLHSSTIAQMIFTKIMPFHSVKPNQETYLLMMKLYSDMNSFNAPINSYPETLWKQYEHEFNLISPHTNNVFTYRILLEYLRIHKHKNNIPKSMQFIVLLKKYGFDTMADWSSICAVLDTVKSLNERNQSISAIVSEDVLFATNSRSMPSFETKQYLTNKISSSYGLVDWWFDWNKQNSIPNKEIYEWIINMYSQIPDHNAYDATEILSNAINQKLISNTMRIYYRRCFDTAQINDYNRILEKFEINMNNDKQFNDYIPILIFINIMPFHSVKPNQETYLVLMKIFSHTKREKYIMRLWYLYFKQGLMKPNTITYTLMLLNWNMFTRKNNSYEPILSSIKPDNLLSQAMFNIAKLQNGEIFKNIAKDVIYKCDFNKDQLRLYLIRIIKITHEIKMENDTSWLIWLCETGKLIVLNEMSEILDTKTAIKQLELELSLMSIGDNYRVSNCVNIVKKNEYCQRNDIC
eukprot:361200_1